MGYLATEIIVLLAGAAVLGLVLGWAFFGLGKKHVAPAGAGAAVSAPSPRVEAELKAERDARKKAEMRLVELESRQTNVNDRLQERDTKVAELSHQLDEQAKYRVQNAAELEARDKKIATLEGQLRQRDADLQRAGGAPGEPAADAMLADRDRLIAKLKADLEAAQAAANPDGARLKELERENAELRETLVATAGAAPTTAGEKDAIIARLNEELTGLRANYESAEQALEEQDAAIDKLTRDLQATQHKLSLATGGAEGAAKPQSGLIPVGAISGGAKPVSAPPAKPPSQPALPQVPPPAPKAAEVVESTVAVSLADLVDQIEQKAPPPKATPEKKPAHAPHHAAHHAPTHAAATTPAAKPADSESTVAVSLADLVDQIDQKATVAPPVLPPQPAAKPAAAPPPPPAKPSASPPPPSAKMAAPAPKAPEPVAAAESESTVALSLDALVAQIDKKPAPPAPPPPKPPAPPATAPESESTLALSLDALVAQIDAAPAAKPTPAAPAAPAMVDASESTVAISLADLVGQIDSEVKLQVAPAPAGAMDDLKEIRGIGPATEKRLNSAGIMTWSQMAGLREDDLLAVADLLKISVDRIKREQWVEQARALGGKA